MKITKKDLEDYRYDLKQAEINNDVEEKTRLKNIFDYVRKNARGKTRLVVIERYIAGDGKSKYGNGDETWAELSERLGLSEGYCKSLCSNFTKQL